MPSSVSNNESTPDSLNFDHKQYYSLDFNSVKEVPESHSWTGDEYSHHPCVVESSSSSLIPVIDLNDQNVQELVGLACKTWGVFQVINHGIKTGVIEDMESQQRRFFSLPTQQKLKVARSDETITGYGAAPISSSLPKLLWSEGFTILGSPQAHARQLWPEDYHQFCDVVEEYEKEMQKLAGRLFGLILGWLGVTQEDVKWADPKGDFNGIKGILHLNSFPVCPDPDRAMGIAAHTDSSLFTIVNQKTIGLQVHEEETGWVTVPPIPGALVVNTGDLLHILSNGLYTSVLHRAMVNRNTHRFSTAYFYGPLDNVEISPLAKLVDSTHPPLYRPVTWVEYRNIRKIHFNNSLSWIRMT